MRGGDSTQSPQKKEEDAAHSSAEATTPIAAKKEGGARSSAEAKAPVAVKKEEDIALSSAEAELSKRQTRAPASTSRRGSFVTMSNLLAVAIS